MKVLVVSSWFPEPPDNGSKLRAFHLLCRLATRHDVTLLSFAEPHEDVSAPILRGMCRTVKTVAGNPNRTPARLGPVDLMSAIPRSYVRTYSREMQQLVDEQVGGHDCAVALQIGATLYLTPYPHLPRVFDEAEAGVIHDRFANLSMGLTKVRRGLTWWKLARFLRDRVARFDRTTVVSEIEKAHLAGAGCDRSKMRVLPNGAELGEAHRAVRPIPGRLIYPGSINFAPNRDAVRFFVDEILPAVRAERPDVSLLVTGAAAAAVHEFAGAGVSFSGHVPDVVPLIAGSWACVVPLRAGGGTRLKILQAMALGTPVVSTSKGAEGIAVTPGHDILIADSPSELARAVVRLLNDSDLRARLAAAGRQLVAARYTWDRVAADLERVIEEAINARSPGRAGIAHQSGGVA